MEKETYVEAGTLDAKTAAWLEAVKPYNDRARVFRPDKSALLVVDMQPFFLEPSAPLYSANADAIIPRARELIDAFRRAGRPVVFLAQKHKAVEIDRGRQLSEWWPRPPLEDSPETAIHPALAPRPEEKIIPKRRYSGFYATDLDLTLRVMGVQDVAICGVLTNVCCEGTARDAFMRDYRVFFAADGTASLTEAMHVGALRTLAGWYAKVVAAGEIIDALSGEAQPAAASRKEEA